MSTLAHHSREKSTIGAKKGGQCTQRRPMANQCAAGCARIGLGEGIAGRFGGVLEGTNAARWPGE